SVCIGCEACAYVCPAEAIDIIIEGDTKIMETWHNTRLKLQACPQSFEFFAPKKELDFVNRLFPDLSEQLKQQSPTSRRVEFSKEFLLKSKSPSSSQT
ncbi:MAG: 4Fe-4S binding protein, partial [Desulfobacterota bacterium]|nr:4Fe-4S binding protein [Thermodesulfobacteriota bacterium]